MNTVQLKEHLTEAYERVRKATNAKQVLQKQLYDCKVHGDPYKEGNYVWLHSTVLQKGVTKKLPHHPWIGPYVVIKRLADATYRIQSLDHRRKRLVVDFNRLKPCTAYHQTEFESSQRRTEDTDLGTLGAHVPVGNQLEIVEPLEQLHSPSSSRSSQISSQDEQPEPAVSTPRYPSRVRRPPNRYGNYDTD